MSDFKFACPECGQKISGDTSYVGVQMNCPACQKPLTVPAAPIAALAAAPVPTPMPQTAALAPAPGAASARPPVPPPPAARAPKPSLWDLASAGQPVETPKVAPAKPAEGYSILAMASFLCSLWIGPGFVPGLICGKLAQMKLRKNPLLKGKEMAAAGLAVSYAQLALLLAVCPIFLLMKAHYKPVVVLRETAPALDALQARVVDEVKFGPAMSGGNESQHHLLVRGNSRSFNVTTNFGRGAILGGGFSYEMKVKPNAPMNVNCRYYGSDQSEAHFDIIVDNQIVGAQQIYLDNPGHYFDVEYKIPASLTKGKNTVTVEFQARGARSAGPLYAVETVTR